jgi:hypothetical protein
MKRILKALIITLLFYLLQTCLMSHLKIAGIVACLPASAIAILTVSYGKKYAFGSSCLFGILFEATTASVGGLFAVIYPVFAMLFAQIFADMSDEKRERLILRQSAGKKFKDEMNPVLRIILDSVCITAALETIFTAYITLAGTDLTLRLILRIIGASVYTGALTILMVFPVRRFLGVRRARIKRAMVEERSEP